MEGRLTTRGRAAVRAAGLVLMVAGSIDATAAEVGHADLGAIGAVVAGASIAGFPLYLLGRRRVSDPLPGSEPAPVGDHAHGNRAASAARLLLTSGG